MFSVCWVCKGYPLQFCSVLLGNIPGVMDLAPKKAAGATGQVVPEGLKRNSVHPLKLPSTDMLELGPSKFRLLQESCSTLVGAFGKAKTRQIFFSERKAFKFEIVNGLLYRTCVKSQGNLNVGERYLVLPVDCRNTVLRMAHESVLARHSSFRKTGIKVRENFFWPGMASDIKLFCKECYCCCCGYP